MAANLFVSSVSAVVFSNTAPITLNDSGTFGIGNPYPSNITVAGLTGNITNVTVKLENMNHTFPDDIDILLVGPGGQNILLMSDVGTGNDLNFVNLTFDDAAAASLPDAGVIGSGSYKPTNIDTTTDALPAPAPTPSANTTFAAAFGGTAANGVWSLFVGDDLGGDMGVIGNGWSITVTTTGSGATTFSNYTPIFINDRAGRASAYPSTINVTGLTGAITDVNVTLTNVNHLNLDDLDILLVSPAGKRLLIMSDAGGTTDVTNVNITIDDEATTDLPDATVIATGSYRPRNYGTGDLLPDQLPPLPGAATGGTATLASVFNGTEANGIWQLYIVDDATTSTGDIMGGWSLDITAGGTFGAKRFTNADFDGDGKTDNGVFRPTDRFWYLRDSHDLENRYVNFGAANDRPVPGDYDGDRRHDIAVFRPSTGDWLILRSSTGTLEAFKWGLSTDTTVHADYDGDGRYDAAVYRSSEGIWYVRQSATTTLRAVRWGTSTDIPVRGHFEGTNGADFTVFRPSENNWYIRNNANTSFRIVNFGATGDRLVPGDYDADGRTDVAVYRPSDGSWNILQSSTGTTTGRLFGSSTSIPVPGDYDGDSRTDIAVWQPDLGNWYILNSGTVATGSSQVSLRIDRWGTTNDIPLATTYLPQQ
ncbi:MAG TPA: hypothetical protein VEX64_00555 [Pyrinomonadaceae bacterium]|nr:hypothetical protein [Pyrinomonadaceae bacterium]